MDTEPTTPDCITFLLEEYAQRLADSGLNQNAVKAKLLFLKEFAEFGREYLAQNRPVRLSYPDNNYCVTLSNNEQMLISPGSGVIKGSMVSATGEPVDPTPGAPVNAAMRNQGAVPISGVNFSKNVAMDYSVADGKGTVDKAAAQGTKDFKKKGMVDDLLNR